MWAEDNPFDVGEDFPYHGYVWEITESTEFNGGVVLVPGVGWTYFFSVRLEIERKETRHFNTYSTWVYEFEQWVQTGTEDRDSETGMPPVEG